MCGEHIKGIQIKNQRHPVCRAAAVVTGVLVLALSGVALAQTPPSAGRLLDESQKAPGSLPKSEPNVLTPPAETPTPKIEQPATRFTPQGFRFIGNTVITNEELTALLAPYVFRETDIDGLNDIVDRVKSYYRERGYFLAVAFLPKQNVSDGAVTIGILEGRLGKIIVEPVPEGARITQQQVLDALHARIKEGQVITEKSIEEPLLLLRDLPGVALRSSLNRGEFTGTADLVVEVLPHAPLVSGDVEFDNYGNRYAGQDRLGVKANLNSPFKLGDQLSFQGFVTNGNLTDFGDLSYLVPVGSLGARLGVSYGHLGYTLGKEFASLDARGTANVGEAYLLYPLDRSKESNLFVQGGIETKTTEDRQGTSPAQKKDVNGLKFELNGDSRGTGYVNVYSVGLTAARLAFGDSAGEAADTGINGFHTGGTFAKVNFSAQRLQQLVPNLALFVSTTGQLASKNLTAAEKFELGGPGGVRGYPTGEATADEGVVGTAELRYTVNAVQIAGAGLVVSTFFDAGHVQRDAKPSNAPASDLQVSNGRTLTSYGLGLTLGAVDHYLVRLSLAWHGSAKPTSDTEDHSPRLWLQSIVWF